MLQPLAILLLSTSVATEPAPLPHSEPWVRSSLPAESLDASPYATLQARIEDGSWKNTHAILVFRDGRLILDDYFLGDDRETLQDIRSCTKSVASILVGIAIDQGFLEGVDQRLMEFFPDYRRPAGWDARKDEHHAARHAHHELGYRCPRFREQ